MIRQPLNLQLFPYTTLFRSHVLGRHRLAVVEFDAVADLQRPDLGVVRRADFLGDAVLELALRRQLDDHFAPALAEGEGHLGDRKSTRLNSSHTVNSYAAFCL